MTKLLASRYGASLVWQGTNLMGHVLSILFALGIAQGGQAAAGLNPTPIVPAGSSFACTPTRVWDGDGPVWCAEGPRVRISGIAAREADGTCLSNQPCPNATADEAKAALVRLLGGAKGRAREGHALVAGPRLSCLSDGPAGGSRTAAKCSSPSTGDLSCAMVETGTVLKWDRYWGDHRC